MLLYYTRDGLWDICVGVCVAGWALALRFDFIALVGVVYAGAILLVPLLKQRLTYRRVGYAKFKPDPGVRKVLAVFVALGLGVLVLVIVAGTGMMHLLRDYLVVWMGGMGALLIAVIGKAFNARRFYVYALLVFAAGIAAQWGGIELWLAVVVAGAAIIVTGTYVLVRFLRENPRSPEVGGA